MNCLVVIKYKKLKLQLKKCNKNIKITFERLRKQFFLCKCHEAQAEKHVANGGSAKGTTDRISS